MKRIFLIIILSSLFLFSTASLAKPVILRAMHVQNSTHESLVTFYLSSSTHYRSFMLHHPNRFVVDLKNVKTFRRLYFQMRKTPINNFKYARHRDGVFRMVFGLKTASVPTIHVLSPDQFHQARLQIIFHY